MKNPDSSSVKTILVVEDEPSINQVCLRVLTREGYKVDVAVNGRVAQDIIEEKQYDLCLLDIRTPKMNGVELYQWLQKKYPQLARRVIFTTGSVMNGEAVTFVEQSGRLFLPKPFTPAEIKTIVQTALKQIENDL